MSKPTIPIDIDGNAFMIIAATRRALREAGLKDQIEEYTTKAQSGDYDNVLRVTMEYVDFV